ncbi:hypothetical protein BGZ83_003173 [Gryganskiella cystojenkinii]|nr:hypothetical protein BGZ83_003173 [Gryganskiella cystojenkinii]
MHAINVFIVFMYNCGSMMAGKRISQNVALSGVWNTYSASANGLFGRSSMEEAKALCYMQSLDQKDTVLEQIADSLQQKKSLEDILDDTYHLQIAHPTGEQGCSASALSKSKLADVFDMGTMPRKCDGILSVDSIEIGNFEFKRASASKLEVACQLRKAIKINKSILLELDKYELECPPLLSVHGMSAIVFSIRKWDDIWVVGKASSTIVLPSTFDELRFFLRDSVHQLANLLEHYHEHAEHVHQFYQLHQYRKKGDDEEEAVSLAPTNVIETLEWEQIVLHTPTKVAKRPSVRERLQRAKEEADEGLSQDENEDWG